MARIRFMGANNKPVRPINIDATISARLSLTTNAQSLPSFFLILQQGTILPARVGTTVRSLLCDQLSVSNDYLDNRINTIFLDGKTVDDVDAAVVRDGSTLSLSASMPGLVGACLRKGGFYAPMRSSISHEGEQEDGTASDGAFILRLFNMVMRELGPSLLSSGVGVEGKALEEFFAERSKVFWNGIEQARADGGVVDADYVKEQKWAEKPGIVWLKVDE
ncbi:hypothetical protein ACFL2Q_13520 [Thermodesulfobacteriota bacterium]